MLKKVKRVFLSVFVVLLVGVVWFGYGALNLKENSVYYAQRTPHREGVEPVLMEVVRNLRWIYTPDIKGIRYGYDGNNIIYNTNYSGRDTAFTYYPRGEYEYYDNGSLTYSFDNRFKLINIWNQKTLKVSDGSVDVSAVKRDIFRVVQPVVDSQPEPFINLQCVYDWVNKDRFN